MDSPTEKTLDRYRAPIPSPGERKTINWKSLGTVVALAYCNIFIGLFGILSRVIHLLLPLPVRSSSASIPEIPLDRFGIMLAVLLVIGGIGLRLLKPWGRMLSIFAAAAYIAIKSFSLLMSCAGMAGLMIMGRSVPYDFLYIALLLFVMRVIYPAILIILLTRSSIKAQFESGAAHSD